MQISYDKAISVAADISMSLMMNRTVSDDDYACTMSGVSTLIAAAFDLSHEGVIFDIQAANFHARRAANKPRARKPASTRKPARKGAR